MRMLLMMKAPKERSKILDVTSTPRGRQHSGPEAAFSSGSISHRVCLPARRRCAELHVPGQAVCGSVSPARSTGRGALAVGAGYRSRSWKDFPIASRRMRYRHVFGFNAIMSPRLRRTSIRRAYLGHGQW